MKRLLCVPRGGLNDTFCQIEKCWRYAERHGRSLIVDSTRSGLYLDFAAFFAARPSAVPVQFVQKSILADLDRVRCEPAVLMGRASSYQAVFTARINNFVDAATGARITFDFGVPHAADLLVHEQCGGGIDSFGLIDRLALVAPVRRAVQSVLDALPADYIGLHVRNTDYTTDAHSLFELVSAKAVGRHVLVCSDNLATVDAARRHFTRSTVWTAGVIPDVQGRPIHDLHGLLGTEQQRQATVASIVDLLALAKAQVLHLSRTTAGLVSGFSRLALYLHSKPQATHHFLNADATPCQ